MCLLFSATCVPCSVIFHIAVNVFHVPCYILNVFTNSIVLNQMCFLFLLLLMVNSTKSCYCVFSLRLMYLLDFNTENIDGQKLILYLKQGIEMACLTPMCSVCHVLVFL
jgi:hypothetical protein